jgi:hypothetical protein
LVVRGTSTFVANIGTDSLVHISPVKVATTDGSSVSIAEGAHVGDRVVLNLPDGVGDGDRVQPVAAGR